MNEFTKDEYIREHYHNTRTIFYPHQHPILNKDRYFINDICGLCAAKQGFKLNQRELMWSKYE